MNGNIPILYIIGIILHYIYRPFYYIHYCGTLMFGFTHHMLKSFEKGSWMVIYLVIICLYNHNINFYVMRAEWHHALA